MTRTPVDVKGYVREKGGKLHTVFDYVDENGEKQRRWKATGLPAKGNKRRAEEIMRERREALMEELERKKRPHSKADTRFSDWVQLWLDECKKRVDEDDLDIITYQGYQENASNHVIPYFEELGITLGEITADILKVYFEQKRENGNKRTKGGLASASLKHHRSIINQALNMAIERKALIANPCRELKPIKTKRKGKKIQFYNQEQLDQLFMVMCNESLFPIIHVAAYYGLRRSEICGLQWNSVDFLSNMFTIERTVVHMQTTEAKDSAKSKTSYRSFPLLPETRELLLRLKALEDENRKDFGREYIESPYIFKWPYGKPYAPDYLTRAFRELIEKHELEKITLRGLRHSCASLLLAQGMNLKMVQEWLGHSDIQLTADTYGHLDMTVKRSIGNVIAECFS